MDGVICDFEKQFIKYFGMHPHAYEAEYGKPKFWKGIDEAGVRFWAGMPWMPEGQKLWSYIEKYNPTLLTAPSMDDSSRIGKAVWRKKHIPGVPMKFKAAKNKADFAAPNTILIDDREDTIASWNAQGGIGILFKSTDQVINELKELGL
jgi:hypothetical protein